MPIEFNDIIRRLHSSCDNGWFTGTIAGLVQQAADLLEKQPRQVEQACAVLVKAREVAEFGPAPSYWQYARVLSALRDIGDVGLS